MNESNKNAEQKILHTMRLWYNKEEQVKEWYNKPWTMLEDCHLGGKHLSPREMVECGKGDKVLAMLDLCIGRA